LRARPVPTQSEGLSDASFLGKLLVLPAKFRQDWKVFARHKHSSLFGLIVSNEEKKFYNIDTWLFWFKFGFGEVGIIFFIDHNVLFDVFNVVFVVFVVTGVDDVVVNNVGNVVGVVNDVSVINIVIFVDLKPML
jgi:hypothetical protein